MKHLLGLAVVLACACQSTPSPSDIAGTWAGTAVTSLTAQGSYLEPITVQVTVDGGTATIAGICGGGAGTVGPGTVEASFVSLGSGVTALWAGHTSCPPRQLGRCASTVYDYNYVSAAPGVPTGDGTTNTLSFSARATSSGCEVNDVLVKSFVGTAATSE